MPFKKKLTRVFVVDDRDMAHFNYETIQNLSYSPSQMAELTKQGNPVSSQIFDSFFSDGSQISNGYIAPENRRGLDIVDAWNLSQDSNDKLYRANKAQAKLNKELGNE